MTKGGRLRACRTYTSHVILSERRNLETLHAKSRLGAGWTSASVASPHVAGAIAGALAGICMTSGCVKR